MRPRAASALLAILGLSMLLGGCAAPLTQPPPAAATATGTAPAAAPTQTQAGPTPTSRPGADRASVRGRTVTFWHSYSLHAVDLLDALVDGYNQENPDGITIEARAFLTEGQLLDALLDASKEELPDLVMGTAGLLSDLQGQGSLADLSPYLDDPGVGLPQGQINAIPADDWDQLRKGPALFGLPAQHEVNGLLYNDAWARDLGYDQPPATFEELGRQLQTSFEANQTSANKAARGTGGWLVDERPEVILSWLGNPERSGGSWKVLSDPGLQDAYLALRTWVYRGQAFYGKGNDPIPYLASRQALVVSMSSREMEEGLVHLAALEMEDDWSVMAYPNIRIPGRPVTGLTGYGIAAGSAPQRLAAWLFLLWLTDPGQQAQISSQEYTAPADVRAEAQAVRISPYPRILEGIFLAAGGSGGLPVDGPWRILRPVFADGSREALSSYTPDEEVPGVIGRMEEMLQDLTP